MNNIIYEILKMFNFNYLILENTAYYYVSIFSYFL